MGRAVPVCMNENLMNKPMHAKGRRGIQKVTEGISRKMQVIMGKNL
jgi:hypothetical protein